MHRPILNVYHICVKYCSLFGWMCFQIVYKILDLLPAPASLLTLLMFITYIGVEWLACSFVIIVLVCLCLCQFISFVHLILCYTGWDPLWTFFLLEPLSPQSFIAFKCIGCLFVWKGLLGIRNPVFSTSVIYHHIPNRLTMEVWHLFLCHFVCLKRTRSAWCQAESSRNPSLAMMSCAMLTGSKVLKWELLTLVASRSLSQ